MERVIGVVGGFTIKYTTVSIAEPHVPRLASFTERARPPRASLDPAQNFVLRQEADVESVPARQVAPSHPHREDDVGQRPRHGIAWQFVAKQNFGIRAVAPWEESASGRQIFEYRTGQKVASMLISGASWSRRGSRVRVPSTRQFPNGNR